MAETLTRHASPLAGVVATSSTTCLPAVEHHRGAVRRDGGPVGRAREPAALAGAAILGIDPAHHTVDVSCRTSRHGDLVGSRGVADHQPLRRPPEELEADAA